MQQLRHNGKLTERRVLGKTDMRVSILGFGSSELVRANVEEVKPLLNSALDAGLNVIDTAECYGRSEEIIGQAVGHRRSDYYLFTKCGHGAHGKDFGIPDWSPHIIEKSVERSLQRLHTDYLDLLLLHSCSEQLLRAGELISALQKVRSSGKVRYIGYSGDRHAARYATTCGAFDVLETSVNIADQEAIDLLLPQARARQMGIIAKRPIANVAWKEQQAPQDALRRAYWHRLHTLRYDFLEASLDEAISTALRFTLSVPGVATAIVGTTHSEHWQDNAHAAETGPLSTGQFEQMHRRWQEVTHWRKLIPGGRWGWHSWV